jgi:hypothetical protein
VQNVNCQKCANTIVNSLSDEFDEVEVILNAEPKEVVVALRDKEQEEAFKKEMESIGYPVIEELERK